MKKTLLKRLTALAVCCGVATSFAFAANAIRKTVTIEYANIKMVVDGIPVTPQDANGKTVEPFIYNGTTYLPVRAVGDAIGKQVTWDGKSKTVYLGEAPGARKWLLDLCPPYQSRYIDTPTTFKMSGQTYTHGFTASTGNTGYAMFNLNGNYSTLSFDLGHIDSTHLTDTQICIYLDGELSQVIDASAEGMVTHFDVPLHNALQLKIAWDGTGWSAYVNPHYGFANCELS